MRRVINLIAVFICVGLSIYLVRYIYNNEMPFPKVKEIIDIKLDYENIYLVIGEEKQITSNYDNVTWYSIDPSITLVQDGLIKGVNPGVTKVYAKLGDVEEALSVTVTDLLTLPKINNKKAYLKCEQYSDTEAKLLDTILNYRIEESGINTRAGVVAAARFLTLEFPYRIAYFYENGRLLTNNTRPYVDGEGRYYHRGLYLSEDKYQNLAASMHGPAMWGCKLYSRITKRTSANGLDCSGFVSWAILNGGFDVGDAGAGINLDKDNDLDDLGEKIKITKDNLALKNYKVGDLLSTYGHIGMLIGISEEYYYIAEALDNDLHILTMSESELLKSDWKYIILMDEVYKKDGNLTNMW